MSFDSHCLGALIRTMERYPQKMAWSDADHALNYDQLGRMISRHCQILHKLGVQTHQRVLLVSDVDLEHIILFYALSLLGAVVVIHAPIKNTGDWHFLVKDIDPHHSFTHFCTTKSRWTPSLFYTDHQENKTMAFSVNPKRQFKRPLRDWLSKAVISADCAMILYTSGSTARPKGIMLSHRNIQAARDAIIQYLAINHQDSVYSCLPFFFDYGLYQSLLCFSVGAHLIQAKALWSEVELQTQCERNGVSIIPITPHFCNLLQKRLKQDSWFSSIRSITSTGAPLLPSHVEALQSWFPSASLFSMYGLTECKRAMYLPPAHLKRFLPSKQLPLGIAIPNTRVQVLRDGKAIKANEEGELVIIGDHVMMGYWNRPHDTNLRYCQDTQQWHLHTGDWVRMDHKKNLFYLGRKDDMFKCKGERVSPKSIEAQLTQTLDLGVCVVCPYPMTQGETGIAVVHTRELIDEDSVKLGCRRLLPASHQPSAWLYLDTLPTLPNGKIDRQAVRAWCCDAMTHEPT